MVSKIQATISIRFSTHWTWNFTICECYTVMFMFDVNFNNSLRHILLSVIVFQSRIQRILCLALKYACSIGERWNITGQNVAFFKFPTIWIWSYDSISFKYRKGKFLFKNSLEYSKFSTSWVLSVILSR